VRGLAFISPVRERSKTQGNAGLREGPELARTISWLTRLQEIKRSVRGSARTHYNRRELELLFGLGPRMAGKMIEMLDTVQVGPSRLVPREVLLRFLERVGKADDVAALYRRLRKRKHDPNWNKPRAMVLEDQEPQEAPALPDWISLSRGLLTIRFEITEQLVQGLALVERMVETHGDEFALNYEPESKRTSEFDRRVGMRGWQVRRPPE
jgi:hypothetical protein